MASEEIKINPGIAKIYQYLARSYAGLGEIEKAKEIILISNGIESSSTESIYANLRVSILDGHEKSIRKFAKELIDTEYSYELIFADPDLSVLKEDRFRDVFVGVK